MGGGRAVTWAVGINWREGYLFIRGLIWWILLFSGSEWLCSLLQQCFWARDSFHLASFGRSLFVWAVSGGSFVVVGSGLYEWNTWFAITFALLANVKWWLWNLRRASIGYSCTKHWIVIISCRLCSDCWTRDLEMLASLPYPLTMKWTKDIYSRAGCKTGSRVV